MHRIGVLKVENYRSRSLLCAGNPNWRLLGSIEAGPQYRALIREH